MSLRPRNQLNATDADKKDVMFLCDITTEVCVKWYILDVVSNSLCEYGMKVYDDSKITHFLDLLGDPFPTLK